MFLEFYGATESVTGSLHRLHINGVDIALDCGLFQGHRGEANLANRQLPDWAKAAHATVLSHAHLDHSGNLPGLVKQGFAGNIYCTHPTRDLCGAMLRDSALIQEQDARYLNRKAQREGHNGHIEPLYELADVDTTLDRMIALPLHRPLRISDGVELQFYNSGHVLGSAFCVLDLQERGKRARLMFTGDVGRAVLPLLRDPELVDGVDVLLMESTYGDRVHPNIAELDDKLADIVRRTIGRGGRVYIPTFALERAQEVLFALERLSEAHKIPAVPIYIDSPLAIAITEIYKLHAECLDETIRERMMKRNDPFSPPGLRYISDVEDSRRLQESGEPCIVIAGSGMCEGGRIVHHLSRGLTSPKNTVATVGFMAQHTLGRRLVEGRREVKVFGVARDVHAEIHSLQGLSAHADQNELRALALATAERGHLRTIALVHGEAEAKTALQARIAERFGNPVVIGERGQRIEL